MYHMYQYGDAQSSPQIPGPCLEAKNGCPPAKVVLSFYIVLCHSCSSITSGFSHGLLRCGSFMSIHAVVSSCFIYVWHRRIFVEVFGLPGNLAAWTLTLLQT